MALARAILVGWVWIAPLELAQIIATTMECVHRGCASAMKVGEERRVTCGHVPMIVGRQNLNHMANVSTELVHVSCRGQGLTVRYSHVLTIAPVMAYAKTTNAIVPLATTVQIALQCCPHPNGEGME